MLECIGSQALTVQKIRTSLQKLGSRNSDRYEKAQVDCVGIKKPP